ncbi:MAG: hypothetical protein EU536_02855 [Promethearchaeota archaeon]|nr:MAG: hypothetical protein EU536_02855 [Candidatus Lokiarchaeota archaeon]
MPEQAPKKGIAFKFKKFRMKLKSYAEVTEVGEIARRYFIMNAFDGALTSLGLVIGFFIAGVADASIIIVTVLAGALALFISGLWSAFLAESAERKRELKQLERAMMTDLSKSIMAKASRFAIIFSVLINGLSPALAATIGVIPFFFGIGIVDPQMLATFFYLSIGVNMILLFLLGMYLGRVSKENVIYIGLKVMAAGVIVTIVLFVINLA